MARSLSPDELATYRALIAAGGLIERAVAAQLAEHGLTALQFSLLATLSGAPGPMRMRDLADAVVHSRSGLTYQVSGLERRGLVARTASAADERGVDVALTDAGRTVLAAAFPGHTDLLRTTLFDGVAPEDLDATRRTLERAVGRVRAAGR
ncbi:MarR family transcriptional regulator [Galbitalea sp. SE-J8]|uniref:MarR family winged helix-turn-helix transcriptional regulator n=1 Tax=Galbitalea sp. SE-J8 TaxID=3054952 RepID=UPI00259CD1FD|nr:MarR family transcriptional regulator [Galbitalea sp. SE-J8]MDM4763833.1 MarR family transcriptional regulator [Galbitalea sp. SE-J8]